MRNKITHIIYKVIICLSIVLAATSCELTRIGGTPDHYDKAMLLYSAGYNNLASYLRGDIEELKRGSLPTLRDENVVLVYSHFPSSGYNTPTSPTLIRLSCRKDKSVAVDTLVTFPSESISASAEQLESVLNYVKETFPAQSYGMVFSSHATGYLPAGFYQNSEGDSDNLVEWSSIIGRKRTAVPYVEPEYDPSLPMVKSIGQDQVGVHGDFLSYEINLTDFADAIPMYLDYILFDACLMGGIEVAYELKDKVGKVGFSQTEVLADGFCYESLTTHLFSDAGPDLEGVCIDYFNQYENQEGVYQSATISLIDCTQLGPLAEECSILFSKYPEELSKVDHNNVQRFYRSGKHWFYDLESILVNAGINEEELNILHEALDACVIYKAHTPMFMSDFEIHTFCGFSMYLPSHGSENLNTFYRTLKWNQDTGLVN
ncbi:MAG: hypothetical protein IKV75_06390 [Bacteroidales bacterium]|nr:hypothetical protein [Bacteroidales bacterium]